jgi:4-hydroxy-2-oxoglutarate aldolase
MKMLLHRQFGYGEKPRRPLLPMSKEEGSGLLLNEYLTAVFDEEKKLSS